MHLALDTKDRVQSMQRARVCFLFLTMLIRCYNCMSLAGPTGAVSRASSLVFGGRRLDSRVQHTLSSVCSVIREMIGTEYWLIA